MESIKIAISGIGGVGGYYGGQLAAFYHNSENVKIYFISRGENLQTIRKKGLEIITLDETVVAHPEIATDDPAEIGVVDYLFCCTKSYDLGENIPQLSPLIGEHTVIVPLLNGVNVTDTIRRIIPGHEVWYGCTYIVTRIKEPGVIRETSKENKLYFGSPEGSKEKQQQLLELLTDAGIDAFNPEDIIFEIWRKYFLISPIATVTSFYNENVGQVMEAHKNMVYKLFAELKAVADAKGVKLPFYIVHKTIENQKMMPHNSTSSMHSDYKKGRRTELETLTGYVVKAGVELGIPTPTYKMMYDKLKKQA